MMVCFVGFDHFEIGCDGSQSTEKKKFYINAKRKGLCWQSKECIKSFNRFGMQASFIFKAL